MLDQKQTRKYKLTGKPVLKADMEHITITYDLKKGQPTVVFLSGMNAVKDTWDTAKKGRDISVSSAFEDYGRIFIEVKIDLFENNIDDILTFIRKSFDSNNAYSSRFLVLVGASIGGFLAVTFTKKYHKKIRGVVLVDATNPTINEKMFSAGKGDKVKEYYHRIMKRIEKDSCIGTEPKVISHVNMRMKQFLGSTPEHMAFHFKLITNKLRYFSQISKHPESIVITHPDTCHDLHHVVPDAIKSSIKTLLCNEA